MPIAGVESLGTRHATTIKLMLASVWDIEYGVVIVATGKYCETGFTVEPLSLHKASYNGEHIGTLEVVFYGGTPL